MAVIKTIVVATSVGDILIKTTIDEVNREVYISINDNVAFLSSEEIEDLMSSLEEAKNFLDELN